MRYTNILTMIVLSCLLVFACKDDDPVDPVPVPGKVVKRTFSSPALEGNALGDPDVRGVEIWLPANYETSDKSYPVLYLLHGMPLGAESFTQPEGWTSFADRFVGTYFMETGDFPQEGFEAWMNGLMEDPSIDEMIIVTPDATSLYGLTMYTNSPLHGNYEEFIAVDLVNYMDTEFRTIPDKQHRYIAGHCQAGYGALRIAMKHPGVFDKVTAFSPFIWTPELFEATGDALYAENPDGLTGPDPNKFFTSALYGFAAAWSPNLDNPPYFVDLPFVFETGEPVPSVIGKWQSQNLFGLMAQYGQELSGLSSLYFDCGDKDELSTNLTNQAFHEALQGAGIPHTYEVYDGTHLNHVYARLESALRFLSQGD